MYKQNFYAIAHNPNSIIEAEQFLKAGANALGPDIRFANGTYYVSHGGPGSNPTTEEHTLKNYLTGLIDLLTTGNYNLAMIVFDVKDPFFDINDFSSFIVTNFLQFESCKNVAVIISTAKLSDVGFLTNYNQKHANIGIAIDEHSNPEEVYCALTSHSQKNIAYANGITSILPKPGLFHSICEAKFLQAKPDGFKLVYVWVLKTENSMCNYLRAGVDGIILDLEEVPLMLSTLQQPEFSDRYQLATQVYNSWSNTTSIYGLTIKTSNALWAGTDASIRFRLSGTTGSLQTIINTRLDKMMERGNTNHITLQGQDIGTIESLEIELLNTSTGCGWLPEYIETEHNSINSSFTFTESDWLDEKHPVLKKQVD